MANSRSFIICLALYIAVFAAVFFTNFPFNSYYTGWDNLHPEFNFSLNFQRGLNAVWQDNQGTGTYGGHGYAATLPHTLTLWLFSWVLPEMYLRSGFTFLMLFLGGLGVFFLTRKLLHEREDSFKSIAAVFGALFYILNFGTVQNFYIELEAFIVHFAGLPWLFFSLIEYLEHHSRKRLIIFTVVSILATVQGFIPPLFFVYLMLLGIFLGFYFLADRGWFRFKIASFVVILTIFINAYWFLPVINYTLTRSSNYLNAYNNLNSTEDFIAKNKIYGTIKDVSILRGFISETIDTSQTGQITYLFAGWGQHLKKPQILAIGYTLFLILLLGNFTLVKKGSSYYEKAFFAGFVLTFSLLATNTNPFSYVSDLLQQVPVAKQAFRIAFTKFSISLSLFYALGLGMGVYFLLSLLAKRELLKYASYPLLVLILGLMFYFSYPIFVGNFIYHKTKLKIPNIYFEMFDFFKTQESSGRISNLPQGWNWGWSIYKWGYSGSGFLWYGINQPILDRSFDVWGKYNEDYFWQLQYALFSDNYPLLDKLWDKYNISWVVLDNNIVPYPNAVGFIYSDKLENYLDQSDKLELAKILPPDTPNTSAIKIYKVKLSSSAKDSKTVVSANALKNIGPSYNYIYQDFAFNKYGLYYTDSTKPFDVYYPFRAPSTQRRAEEFKLDLEEVADSFIAKTSIPKPYEGFQIDLPIPRPEEAELRVSSYYESPTLAVNIPKEATTSASYTSLADKHFLDHKATDCDSPTSPSEVFKQEVIEGKIVRFTSINSENCYNIILDKLPQKYAYLVQIENRHIEGKRMQFALIDLESKKENLINQLTASKSFVKDYQIIPPFKQFGAGYNLSFNNVSLASERSINDLKQVNLTPLPLNYLMGINFYNAEAKASPDEKIVIFYQSYDPGWGAYVVNKDNKLASLLPSIFGTKLTSHFVVNNWANGWKINQDQISADSEVKIIYGPQNLQLLGIILLLLASMSPFALHRLKQY